MSEQMPYMTLRSGRGYEAWTRGKKGARKCLGTVVDVPPHQRAERGRWEAKRNGEVVGSAALLLEATALLWNTRDTTRIP